MAISNPSSRPREIKSDILIIGSGIAGLYTAIKLADHYKINLVTKRNLEDSNTANAQGGIAAAICPKDKPEYHIKDTLIAGAGLCKKEAVQILAVEGPARIQELVDWGAGFDRNPDGSLSLTREAAHSHRRILHANGDATGAEISRVLAGMAVRNKNISIYEYCFVKDLLVSDGFCRGAVVSCQEETCFTAGATILATGGIGQLYAATTNPEIATGDGFSLAYRAGCSLTDLEFIQFHPTALKMPSTPPYLISESVRGEGAFLLNSAGERFMSRYDPRAELAPRDIVARAIATEIEKTGSSHVFLDLTHWDQDKIKTRFPTVYKICRSAGLNPASDLIPVAPAAHYIMGGVSTDIWGQTTLPGLYACGEVACTGVHGANRLASNSLLEALVFGNRIAHKLTTDGIKSFHSSDFQTSPPAAASSSGPHDFSILKKTLQEKMSLYAGIKRNAGGLSKLEEWCKDTLSSICYAQLSSQEIEVYNMIQLAHLISRAALIREESRGGHYREDFPASSAAWEKHTFLQKEVDMHE